MMEWLLTLPGRALRSADIIGITIAAIVCAFVIWPGWLSRAREDGALEERGKWVAAQEEATAKRDAAVAKAQTKIDTAETAMLDARLNSDVKISELEKALAVAQGGRNENEKSAGEGNRRCLPRRMPDGVRKALNAFRPG